ncbi:unnamed protein product, partial [Timema podura]|nr:unnamed protein product [Timema podura]
VLTPQKCGDVYLYPSSRVSPIQPKYDVPPTTHISVIDDNSQGRYAVPPSRSSLASGDSQQDVGEQYDVPPSRTAPASYDTPRSTWRSSPAPHRDSADSYDVPRPLAALQQQQQLTPSSSASSLTADSVSSSNRSSLALTQDYDVPRGSRGPQFNLNTIQQQVQHRTGHSRVESNFHRKGLI